MAALQISNRQARELWLWTNGLAATPTGPFDLMAIIRRLGFVQIDTIRNVTRAHNHILWSRNQNIPESAVWQLLKQRDLFEHYSHDACLLPMEFIGMWERQFQKLGAKTKQNPWYHSGLDQNFIAKIKARIEQEGPLSTHAFDTKVTGPRQMWARPPHKKALDQMWYAGELMTAYRENFVKYYDVAARVRPKQLHIPEDAEQVDWFCHSALDRLSMGTAGDIQKFWGVLDAREVKGWLSNQQDLQVIDIKNADGSVTTGYAPVDIGQRLMDCPTPTRRLRILNPFDPVIRDRKRLKRLFGFEYVNEMFVPIAKRRWGYYVYPLLEAARFVGRIEITADRAKGVMRVIGFWPEHRVKWGAGRKAALNAELVRFARFAGLTEIEWMCAEP